LSPDRVAGSGNGNRSLGEGDHAVDRTHPVQGETSAMQTPPVSCS
jgi:hypothetical protein